MHKKPVLTARDDDADDSDADAIFRIQAGRACRLSSYLPTCKRELSAFIVTSKEFAQASCQKSMHKAHGLPWQEVLHLQHLPASP